MQYTIRRIPEPIDAAIRERARSTGKSLNEAVIDVLADGAGVRAVPRKRRDLSDIAGTWKADTTFDSVVGEHDRIDKDVWC